MRVRTLSATLPREPCILSHKWSCPMQLLQLPGKQAKLRMSSTAWSFWKRLESPLCQDPDSVRKKGTYLTPLWLNSWLFLWKYSLKGYVLTVTGMWKQDLSCSDNNLTIGERHARNHGFFQEVQLGLHDSILRLKVEALRLTIHTISDYHLHDGRCREAYISLTQHLPCVVPGLKHSISDKDTHKRGYERCKLHRMKISLDFLYPISFRCIPWRDT